MERRFDDTVRRLVTQVLGTRCSCGGFAYGPQRQPYVEPTVLATLGLVAMPDDECTAVRPKDVLAEACRWVASLQQQDGAVANGPSTPTAVWQTPYAALLWSCDARWNGEAERAIAMMTALEGRLPVHGYPQIEPYIAEDHPGWPWTRGLPSWVEPTSLALLALKRRGMVDHPRVGQAVASLRERAVPSGGWNYGNARLFNADLRPVPSTTGLALLGLAGLTDEDDVVTAAIGYLSSVIDDARSPRTLCWGLLALHAWRRPHGHQTELVARAAETAEAMASNDMAAQFLLAAARAPAILPGLGIGTAGAER